MYQEEMKQKGSVSILERIFHRRKKRLFSNIELEFQKYLDAFTLFSIVLILMGVVLAIWNSIPELLLRIFIGGALFVFSLCEFYFFVRRRELSFYNIHIFYGIVALILGILLFFQENVQGVLNLFGVFYLMVSLQHYLESYYMIRLRDKDVIVFLVSNVLIDFMAILLFINPFSQLLGGEILGVFLILFGIIHISLLSFLSKKSSSFLSFFES